MPVPGVEGARAGGLRRGPAQRAAVIVVGVEVQVDPLRHPCRRVAQTLYSAWGSKRALLRAHQEYAFGGSPTSVTDDTWRFQARAAVDDLVRTTPGVEARLRAAAAFYRQIAECSALAWQLSGDAAAVDPQVSTDRATSPAAAVGRGRPCSRVSGSRSCAPGSTWTARRHRDGRRQPGHL